MSVPSPARRRLLRCSRALVLASLSTALPLAAQTADNYPSKPIRLIVPFAAGGSTDIVARVLADGLRSTLGKPVQIDNRGGAGGLIGTEAVAQAPADGYTVGMATVSTMTINPLLYTRAQGLGAQLMPVANLVTMPSVWMAHPGMGVNHFSAFLAKVRARPGAFSAGVPGMGTLGHLMLVAFNDTLKTDIQIVPYRGAGPALNDALAGQMQIMTDQLPSALPQIKAGRLVPVAVSANARLAELPGVPTLGELGHHDLNALGISWFGLVVPRGTPAPIVKKLREAAVRTVQLPEVQERLKALGAAPTEMDQSRFASQIAAEIRRNRMQLEKAGLRAD